MPADTTLNTPVVSIRTDCNAEIGYGHVMRCLTVAKALCRNGAARAGFLMTQNSDAGLVESAGFEVLEVLSGETDIEEILIHASPEDGPLLLDSYTFNTGYLEMLRQTGYRVAVFDDGNRLENYPCDVVVDSAPDAASLPYRGLPETRFCLGSDYFPLRAEFLNHAPRQNAPDQARTIAVTFGGSDPGDVTSRVLEMLAGLDGDFEIRTVLGPGYQGNAKDFAGNDPRVRLHQSVTDMAAVLADADIAISGGGGTASELAYLGVPMVLLALSANQAPVVTAMQQAGAAVTVDGVGGVVKAVNVLIGDRDKRSTMSRAGRAQVDGKGAERIAETILSLALE